MERPEASRFWSSTSNCMKGTTMVGTYNVITLCGSTRFKDAFIEAQKRLTLEGNIVISVGLFGHSGDTEVWEGMSEDTLTKTKEMLDDMHKRKIDMADEIFVINVGGFIGSSTRSEIEYAIATGKAVRYLEPLPKEHTMRLDAAPFAMIASGAKTIELRLYDEKRRQISIGDIIRFCDNSDPSRILVTKVKRLDVFDSFEALYEALPLTECGYTAETVRTASPDDMRKYYSAEQERKYGVVGIKIEKQ